MTFTKQCCVCGQEENNDVKSRSFSFFCNSEVAKKIWLSQLLDVGMQYKKEEIYQASIKFLDAGDFLCSKHFQNELFNENLLGPDCDSKQVSFMSEPQSNSNTELVDWEEPPQLTHQDENSIETVTESGDDSFESYGSPPSLIPIIGPSDVSPKILSKDFPAILRTNALGSSAIIVPSIEIKEEKTNEPLKLEKTSNPIFCESYRIDGETIHSFATIADLEKFTNHQPKLRSDGENSSPQSKQNNIATLSCSSSIKPFDASRKRKLNFDAERSEQRLSKRSVICLTIEDSSDESPLENFADLESMKTDTSFLAIDASAVLSVTQEPYVEDYDVPNRRCNEMPWLTMMCRKRFCRLGCVCESLNAMKSPLQHCKHVDCMILCTCENPCGTSEPECVSDVAQIPSRQEFQFDDLEIVFKRVASDIFDSKMAELADNLAEKLAAKMVPQTLAINLYHERNPMNDEDSAIVPDGVTPDSSAQLTRDSVIPQEIQNSVSSQNKKNTSVDEIDVQEGDAATISQLGVQLEEKNNEINTLKTQLNEKLVTTQMAECFPKLLETAKNYLSLISELDKDPLKADANNTMRDNKVKPLSSLSASCNSVDGMTASAKKYERKNESASARTTNLKPTVIGTGLCLGFYPFNKATLDLISLGNTPTGFIREVMRKMFTVEYLTCMTLSRMNPEYLKAITDETLSRFPIYHPRNSEPRPLSVETIKITMSSEFSKYKRK